MKHSSKLDTSLTETAGQRSMPRTRKPVSRVRKAKYSGTCARCTRRFSVGAPIVLLAGSGPCHVECAPEYPAGEQS